MRLRISHGLYSPPTSPLSVRTQKVIELCFFPHKFANWTGSDWRPAPKTNGDWDTEDHLSKSIN